MNLIEAIKSRRWFGRPTVKSQAVAGIKHPFCGQDDGRVAGPNGYVEVWRTEDLLADDWETKEPTVTITFQQLADAISTTPISNGMIREMRGYYMGEDAVNEIARKLGLESP